MVAGVLASLAMMFPILSREQLWFERTVNYSILKVMSGEAPAERNVGFPDEWNFPDDDADVSDAEEDSEFIDYSFLDGEDVPLPGGLEDPVSGPRPEETESAAEIQLRNSNQRLAYFEYGEEQLALNAFEGGHHVVSVNSRTVRRVSYDSNWRLVEKLVFANGKSVDAVRLLARTSYSYREEDPVQKYVKPYFMREELFDLKKTIETEFNESGKPLKVSVYSDEGDKHALVRVTERGYDAEERISVEEETSYYAEGTETKRNEFTYTEVSGIPDLRFYENGKLRLEDRYLSEDIYEETLYFDGDVRVRVKYEHGRRTREIIFSGDTEISRRNFD